jgi:hypothetical protein
MITDSPKISDPQSEEKQDKQDGDALTASKTESNKTTGPTSPSSPQPSHITTGEYAALMETNGGECESWFYFIKREGNESALAHLQEQLEKVEWFILDDLSTFDLDLEHFVSAKTAKEMTKLELNAYAFHRKFDGTLKRINFKFKSKDLKSNERMMGKVFDLLGYGQIEDYISDEDLDPEDLVTDNSSSSDNCTEDESSDSEEERPVRKIDKKTLPASLCREAPTTEIPRFAKKKQGKARKRI